MGLFSNPLGHAGYPPNVTGTPSTQPASVRAATPAEAAAGVLNDVYISPQVLGSGAAITSIASAPGSDASVGNATGQVGFFGSAGATVVSQAALTNSVTSGGTTGTIADFTDLTTYATDAPTIRNDIYQLALALSNVITALRAYGLLQ